MRALIEAIADQGIKLEPTSGGVYRFKDDTISVFVAKGRHFETFKDKNIPSINDLTNDGEMFADGIPELVASGNSIIADHKKWTAQGWWPNRREVEGWVIMIRHLQTKKTFTASFKDKNEALEKAKIAAESIRNRRKPVWMQEE